jgi:hypothetical protein
MWDLLLVTIAKLVAAIAQPILRWRARTAGPRQRRRIATMTTTPIASADAGPCIRVAGTVEAAAAAGARALAFFVRDDDGARALVQPASAAGIWSADGSTLAAVAPGDRVDVVGVARRPDPRVDRELAGSEARLVFAGSEANPLFIVRR